MKYLLFDTNIYIDMIINRRKNINSDLMDIFSSLLNFGEVMLILPDIVKYEVYKHIDSELNKVSALIKESIKSINGIYWLTGIKGDNTDVDQFKKDSIKPLHDLSEMFEKNYLVYSKEVRQQIDLIFTENTISISEDVELLNRVMLRRIYKKAPFHHEKKESYADGLITETLLNIKKYVGLNADDLIYFVSANYSDFSQDNEHRDQFHDHIQSDLIVAELDKKVIFVASFAELVGKYLKKEVIKANLEEEFHQELSINDSEFNKQYEDSIRTRNGLTPFTCFNEMVETRIINSKDSIKLINIFKKINKIYSAFDEYFDFYEELLSKIENISESDKNGIKKKFNKMLDVLGSDDNFKSFEEISEYIESEMRSADFESATLPKYLELSNIFITTAEHDIYELCWKNEKLIPINGGDETIYLELRYYSQFIARGIVDVCYGYVELDDTGEGDGYKEDVKILK